MCLDCGCGELNESHDDARHITMDSIRSAAEASGISVDETIKNMQSGLNQAKQESQGSGAGSGASH
jgi:hypothetical protein